MIEVRVPATSANLGPGFDCMGIALKTYATFQFERMEQGLSIEGCATKWQNEENLVYQGFLQTLAFMKEKPFPLHIKIDSSGVPEARGLGSSAVCIVAGAMAANAFFQHRLNKYDIFNICTQMEGHPDNVAPAIFGSLTVSFMEDDKPNMIRYLVNQDIRFCTIIPDYETLTEEARAVLPKQLSYQDAIYNMGRCAALAKALEIGNPLIIKHACKDRMHQPYRKSLIKEYEDVQALCTHHNALACYISGSGSTMIAICDNDATSNGILHDIQMNYPTWKVMNLDVDITGATVKEV